MNFPGHDDSRDGGGTRPWMVEGRATQEQLPRAASGTAAERASSAQCDSVARDRDCSDAQLKALP